MSKLLKADMNRIFKSKVFLYCLIFNIALAVIMIITQCDDNPLASIPLSMPLIMFPMIVGAFIGLIVGPEFTNGAVRNKIIVGHSRTNILISWATCFLLALLIFFAVYEISVFSLSALFSIEMSEINLSTTLINLIVTIILLAENTMFSLMICVIIKDIKAVAILIIIQEPLQLITMMCSEMNINNNVLKFIYRFIPQGQANSLNILVKPDKPWLTILCSASLGFVLLILTLVHFKKVDLK